MSEMKTYTGSVALREAKPRSKRLQGSRITVTRNSVTDGGAVSTDFDKMFELENTGTQSDPVYRIKAKYGLYTEHFIVAGSPSSDSDGGGESSSVAWSQRYTDSTNGEHIADITIDDSTIAVYAPKGPAAAVGATASDNGYVSGSLLYGILGDSFSASNTLKDFINSSIASNTATFRGTFESAANLPTTGVVNNDYAFVYDTDGDYYRYKYNGSAWVQEYKLNNSGFTAAQWATVNSGLTAAHVSKLDGLVATGSSTLPIYFDSNQRPQTITGLSVPGDVCARNIQVNANKGISAYNSTEAQSLFMLSFNWWMYNGSPNGTIAPEVSDAFNFGDYSHFWSYVFARNICLGGRGGNIWGATGADDPILSIWGSEQAPYGDIVLGWHNADARRDLRLAAKDTIFIDFAGTTAYLIHNTHFYPNADREAWLGASNKMWKNVFSEDYYAKSFIAWKKRGDTYTAGSSTETASGGFLFYTRYLNSNDEEVWETTLNVVPGSIGPGANNTIDLGTSGTRWNNLYANRWYPNSGDSSHYIEYDSTNGALHIVGNLRVDGFVVSGAVGSGSGGGGGLVEAIYTVSDWNRVFDESGADTFNAYAIKSLYTGKQDTISDLSTIRSRADEGHTAYGWGNHASAGYITGIDSSDVVSALGYTPLSSYDLSGYATETWVGNQGFLTSSDISSLTLKVGNTTVGTYDPDSGATLTITKAHITGLGIQAELTSSNKLNPDYVTTDSTHRWWTDALSTTLSGKQDALTFDDAPTANSNNPVKSGGIKTALDGKQATLTFDDSPTANSTNPVKSGGVYTAVNGRMSMTQDDAVSRNITPSANATYSLGSATAHWDKVFAGGLYPLTTTNTDAKLVYDSSVGGFKVTGNLVVSGNVVSGTAGSSDLEDYVELSRLSSMDEYDTFTSAEQSKLDNAMPSIYLGLIRRIKVSSTVWISITGVVPDTIYFTMVGSSYITDGTHCCIEYYEGDWRLVTV